MPAVRMALPPNSAAVAVKMVDPPSRVAVIAKKGNAPKHVMVIERSPPDKMADAEGARRNGTVGRSDGMNGAAQTLSRGKAAKIISQ